MNYPHFFAIDASSYEDNAHPIALAWSMKDGAIKTTLIQPEDDWTEWDFALQDMHGINQETLFQMGETVWSVIRELENDLQSPLLHCDDDVRSDALLEKLYEACGRDVSLETQHHLEEAPKEFVPSQWIDDTDFHHQPCDERVRLMLMLWVDFNQK
ncbi:MAG: hypothetical protein P1U57_09890 [Oleibacter sp.]|nr:hypothetical protein [Thalassolituus sp.]